MSPDERSLLFREVNDRIYELLESAEPDLHGEFLCECGRECGRRVMLLPVEFAALSRAGELVLSPDCGGPRCGSRGQDTPLAGGIPVPS